MPYRLGHKNVTKTQFLLFLNLSRKQIVDACEAGVDVLCDLGVGVSKAQTLAGCVEAILCANLDMEMAEIQEESPELNSPVDMKEFMALQDTIATMEAQIEQLKVGEQNAMPEVRPGISGMRMMFENQLRSMRERRRWMQEELEKFEAHAPTLNAAPVAPIGPDYTCCSGNVDEGHDKDCMNFEGYYDDDVAGAEGR